MIDSISFLISFEPKFPYLSINYLNSSILTLLLNKYYRSDFNTWSFSTVYTSSNETLVSNDEATSAMVLDTSLILAFRDNPVFSSDLDAYNYYKKLIL